MAGRAKDGPLPARRRVHPAACAACTCDRPTSRVEGGKSPRCHHERARLCRRVLAVAVEIEVRGWCFPRPSAAKTAATAEVTAALAARGGAPAAAMTASTGATAAPGWAKTWQLPEAAPARSSDVRNGRRKLQGRRRCPRRRLQGPPTSLAKVPGRRAPNLQMAFPCQPMRVHQQSQSHRRSARSGGSLTCRPRRCRAPSLWGCPLIGFPWSRQAPAASSIRYWMRPPPFGGAPWPR